MKAENYQDDFLQSILDESVSNGVDAFVAMRYEHARTIKQGLKRKGWTQKQLAEAMGKEPSEISKWVSGTHNFQSDTLLAIAKILGICFKVGSEYDEKPKLVVKYSVENLTNFSNEDMQRYIDVAGGLKATGYHDVLTSE